MYLLQTQIWLFQLQSPVWAGLGHCGTTALVVKVQHIILSSHHTSYCLCLVRGLLACWAHPGCRYQFITHVLAIRIALNSMSGWLRSSDWTELAGCERALRSESTAQSGG